MALTPGLASQVSVTAVSDSILVGAAVSGTTPYTYQWYRATSGSNFTPGSGNSIASATALALSDSGLTPGTVYYYKNVVTDANGTPVVATSSALTVTTLAPSLSQNVINQVPFLGMTDQKFNSNTLSVMFDPAGTGTLTAGQAVKWSTVANGVPMVLASTATTDTVAGFVNLSFKDVNWAPGAALDISMRGNVIYLYAATAINRGNEVTSLPSGVAGGCNGGVIPAVGSGGLGKVGFSLDTAAIGALCRIFLSTPAYVLS